MQALGLRGHAVRNAAARIQTAMKPSGKLTFLHEEGTDGVVVLASRFSCLSALRSKAVLAFSDGETLVSG